MSSSGGRLSPTCAHEQVWFELPRRNRQNQQISSSHSLNTRHWRRPAARAGRRVAYCFQTGCAAPSRAAEEGESFHARFFEDGRIAVREQAVEDRFTVRQAGGSPDQRGLG